MGKDDQGNFEYIDFSHTNPYDLLSRGFRTVLNSYKEADAQSTDFKGTVRKICLKHCLSISLLSWIILWCFLHYKMCYLHQWVVVEAEQDLVQRYTDLKMLHKVAVEKSLLHLINTIIPGGVPIRVPVGADLGIAGGNFQPVKGIENLDF